MWMPPLVYILFHLQHYVYKQPLVGPMAEFFLKDNYNMLALDAGGEANRNYAYATIAQGTMKGLQEFSRTGRQFYWFRGIPYAQPPVGALRFEPPEPHPGWEGELDATDYGNECTQYNFITQRVVGSENCLFINVATRKLISNGTAYTKEGSYPVIYFIHGGLFMWGQANPLGPRYFMDENVVLVTINYRLASFGFLNTGDGVIQGNMGLKDQVQGLRWVQENIHHFNGDPDRVTIAGESAGSASVHLLTLSPTTRGLFSGAISQSGTALSPWAHVHHPDKQAKEFAEGLGCPTNNGSEAMVACLKQVEDKNLAMYHRGAMINAIMGQRAIFGPTVDSGDGDAKFLPENPLKMMQNGQVSEKPWICGVNSGDGLVYLIAVLRNESLRQYVNSHWQELGPRALGYDNSGLNDMQQNQLTRNVREYYLKGGEISQEQILESNDLFSDRGFFLDSHDVAIMQSRVAPTYVYYYSYEGVFSGGNLLFTKSKLPLPSDYRYILGMAKVWFKTIVFNMRQKSKFGVCHGDEMPLLFNIPLLRREVLPSDPDFEFSRKLVRLWSNFAEDGIPDTGSNGALWEPVQVFTRGNTRRRDMKLNRLHLNDKLEIIEEPFYDRLQFWRNNSVAYLPEDRYRHNIKTNFV